jgi:hypothetical protein
MNRLAQRALVSVFLALAALAQQPESLPPPPDKDPFVGTWQANRDKSQPKLGKKDASYTRTIAREGEDLLFLSRTATSKSRENSYKIRCDGLFHPVPFGSLSCKYSAHNLIEGETTSSDGQTGYWSREVSPDGQEMKILSYKNSGRTEVMSIWILDRVK